MSVYEMNWKEISEELFDHLPTYNDRKPPGDLVAICSMLVTEEGFDVERLGEGLGDAVKAHIYNSKQDSYYQDLAKEIYVGR